VKPAKFVSYPLTPPASDASTAATEVDSDSEDSTILGLTQFTIAPPSPENQPLHVNIISDKDGRTEVALCARQIAAFQRDQKNPLGSASLFQLDINTLDAVLEGELLKIIDGCAWTHACFSQTTITGHVARSFHGPRLIQKALGTTRVPALANPSN
jgi:hypothetical protein